MPETPPEHNAGWYFDDFAPGQVVRTMGRTVTEADIVNFVTWAGIFEETFINADFARKETLFKARVAPGFRSGAWSGSA